MKYFTRDLFEMGQSQDDAILSRQEELWDEACERYFNHLEALKPWMPAGLRQIVDSYYLHDAVVHGLGRRDRVFVMMLQLDTPPQSLLNFTYELVEEPTILADALPPGRCGNGPSVEWQYNEIEMVPGEPPTWRESLLLSNGWEVRLHFTQVQVQEVQALIPAPRNGSVAAVAASVSHTS